jgi:predicted lipoprotein with Yx(FWY)xxD motif
LKQMVLAALLGGLTACTTAADPARTTQTAAGPVLANSSGMTLYTFDRDSAGKSNCNRQCAVNWPPLKADGAGQPSGDWSVVTRDDGSKQWAYKGKPLYTWVKDQKPGDTTGNGVNNNTWHIAQP